MVVNFNSRVAGYDFFVVEVDELVLLGVGSRPRLSRLFFILVMLFSVIFFSSVD